jgi:hypothetical protein
VNGTNRRVERRERLIPQRQSIQDLVPVGREPLRLQRVAKAASYWIERRPPETMSNQF